MATRKQLLMSILCLGIASCSSAEGPSLQKKSAVVKEETTIQKRILVIEKMSAGNPPANGYGWTAARPSTLARMENICLSEGMPTTEFDSMLENGVKIITANEYKVERNVNGDIVTCTGTKYIVEGSKKYFDRNF